MSARSYRLHFFNPADDELVAYLETPPGEPRAYALFAHCFTCSKDLKPVFRISRMLAEAGIAVLRFDFTGLGESEGDFAETNFSSNLEDLVAAADFLRGNFRAPSLLIGHSLGGTAVLAAAAKIPEVELVATIAAPAGTDHLRNLLVEKGADPESDEGAEIDLGGRTFPIRRQLLADLESHNVADIIANLGKPILVFHSPADRTVDIAEADRILDAAQHPKSLLVLEGADHLLLKNPADARFIARALIDWAERYLSMELSEAAPAEETGHWEGMTESKRHSGAKANGERDTTARTHADHPAGSADRSAPERRHDAGDEAPGEAEPAAETEKKTESGEESESEPETEEGTVIAIGEASGYRTHIVAGRHRFLADEPERVGGGDEGPNPYDLLLAGLGACTAMTLRMYADRKEWPLEETRVELTHTRIHAEDCTDCETKEGKVDLIERRLSLTGDLSEDQRQRLLEIADRCPVSRTLTSETRVRDELVER